MHESDERYPPPLCHPGTREVVVIRIVGWYLDSDKGEKRIMWVQAPAGYGKTAVAGTVTEKLRAMREELGFSPVGATFFFWRTSPERNSPSRFIITLAYQLAQSIPELRPRIETVVKSEPGIVKMALEIQLVKLIVQPFKCIPDFNAMPNRLAIVDGIDECINSDRESRMEKQYAEQQEIVQIRVLDLIHYLQSHHLPLSFLILSRQEAWIKRHLESSHFREMVEPLDLQEVGNHMADVKRYVRVELSRIARSYGLEGIDEEWPEEDWLVSQSDGHILYAATVIRHIDDPYGDPRQLLKDIVKDSAELPAFSHSAPLSSLYELYRQIMRSCPERNRALMLEVLEDVIAFRIRKIVRRLPCGKALDLLDRLSRRSHGSGIKALRPLHAVLRIGNMNEPMYNLFIHSSFTEFLSAPFISMEFSVDLNRGEERLLSNIINCMTSITMNAISEQLEEHILFALNNWCPLWSRLSLGLFRKSRAAHIRMIKKMLALDLPACLIQSYLGIDDSQKRNRYQSPVWRLFSSSEPSNFLVEPMQLNECDSIMIHTTTSHTKSSLEAAFISLLRATDLPAGSPRAVWLIACDCVDYLKEVVSRVDWRENKLVQELRSPGPKGIDLFMEIFQQYAPRDLRRYIYRSMVRDRNPILEREDHPFQDLLEIDGNETGSDAGIDPKSLSLLIGL
ncbi:hypothetical protein EST38_g737 [Candolleomyces aberdarensis]|uniref:Nephrocystin 3-like N-terminal domain-containing protein n=1 Tax=Candolleomyces aberdarensis TaxID=2316362 RepID=A0A4Q2DYT6_9AGAR|nr:hypothetical protein EST38_g737 [Candolleomyces aberdarensis]